MAWGFPHKVLSSGELPTQSPRKVFPVGIAWGGFAWVSETGVCPGTLRCVSFNDVSTMATCPHVGEHLFTVTTCDVGFHVQTVIKITSRFVWRFRELRKRDEQ